MAHYAFLDQNNIVTEVIVGKNEGEDGINWESQYSAIRGQPCKRTSYNTSKGKHLNGGVPFRKNYAGIGYTYDSQRDAFIPPKIYTSWVLNEETCQWEAPIPLPVDAGTQIPFGDHFHYKQYKWDEPTLSWVEVYT